MPSSPFLHLPSDAWLTSNALAFAIFDRFPVSPGHTLIITKRLIPTWFDATTDEQHAIISLVNDVKQHLDATLQPKPAGYNVGFNVGEAAGQTVMHLHVHVIPRYAGDMPDPRGGVRHVIPSNGNYLAPPPASSDSQPPPSHLQLVTGYPQSNLWDQLSHRLPGAQLFSIACSEFLSHSPLGGTFHGLCFRCTNRHRSMDFLQVKLAGQLDRYSRVSQYWNAPIFCTSGYERFGWVTGNGSSGSLC